MLVFGFSFPEESVARFSFASLTLIHEVCFADGSDIYDIVLNFFSIEGCAVFRAVIAFVF